MISDGVRIGAALLVAGPLIGTVCMFYPPFFRVWTVGRAEHLALVVAHRRAWTMANVGFFVGTALTAGGLAALAGSLDLAAGPRAILVGGTAAYVIGGALWSSVLAIRNRTTPLLGEMVASGTPTEPGEALLGAALGGLFAAFMVTTGASIMAIAAGLGVGGAVAAPVASIAALIAALSIVGFIAVGDMLPAVLYPPTLVVGIAILAGWT
ncbi:MAG TPA: hypothetical protein VHM48_08150 [Candidatus Limnocylindrales bacterium]|nr:hypothetical protein [Candidatus Limnocylindrales bacterium]